MNLSFSDCFCLYFEETFFIKLHHILSIPVHSHWNLIAETVRKNSFFFKSSHSMVCNECAFFLPPRVSRSLCLHMHLDDCFPRIQPRIRCVTVTVKRSVIHRYGTIRKTYCKEHEDPM